jgi:hypothetical protein
MPSPPLHPEVTALALLLGTWSGSGEGHYPTISPFRYTEQVTFGHVGQPFLAYTQQTWHPDTAAPMHAEVGYLRGVSGDAVELVLAHPTGIVEVEEGRFDGAVLELATTTVGRTTTAKEVRSLRRRFELDGDTLRYDVWMAHADTPESHHLHAELSRVVLV